MKMKDKLLGKCGFYCGACPTFLQGNCSGCADGQRTGNCFTRDCVLQKGIPFCGACEAFPCDTILTKERCTVPDKAWLQWKKQEREQIKLTVPEATELPMPEMP